jgi:hypothetical protein
MTSYALPVFQPICLFLIGLNWLSWGKNLKTKSKMPEGNIRSQSKAVRHFGHRLVILARAWSFCL